MKKHKNCKRCDNAVPIKFDNTVDKMIESGLIKINCKDLEKEEIIEALEKGNMKLLVPFIDSGKLLIL